MFSENIINLTYYLLLLLHHYQNASFQGGQIQCRKDQMQVSHVEKNMVEQNNYKVYLNHTLGLTLSIPGIVTEWR